MQGRINDKPVSSLIRGLARKNAGGLLRFSRGKTIKAIFFEAGAVTFAISNVPQEQLDYKLVQNGLVRQSQIDEARERTEKANKLGSVLVEMGVLSQECYQKSVEDLVKEIILSLFEWEEGDYLFDERMRAAHDVTISIRTTDFLLEGARLHSANPRFAQQVAPPDAVLVRPSLNKEMLDSGKLVPMESYVLSRIESPTVVGEVGALSGLSDDEAQRAVCALLAGGFLKLMGDDREEDSSESTLSESADKLREDITRKLHFFVSADFYEILEVGRQATMAEIKASYYQLAKRYHPDRYRQPELAELRTHLETLFARVSQAYDTLIETGSRSSYDLKLRKENSSNTSPLRNSSPATVPTTGPLLPPLVKPKSPTSELTTDQLKQQTSASPPTKDSPSTPLVSESRTTAPSSSHNAEFYYQQGRARLERKDYHTAVHMLKEAVKLDQSKAIYHFHLGVALLRNPRTRREAEEHLGQAAELDKFNAQLRVKLGQIYKEAGLKKRAEQYFKDALSLDPDNRGALKGLDGAAGGKKEPMASIWKSDMGTIAKRLFKR